MKPFPTTTLVILALVAVVHALRLLMGWSVTIGGSNIPVWVSVVAFVVAAGLAVGLWRSVKLSVEHLAALHLLGRG